MPKGAEPFAVTLGLMVATMLVAFKTFQKLDGRITSLGIESTKKTQLLRSANWYSDSTQTLAILVPPVVGLAVGTASGSETLVIIYWAVIVITFVTLLFFGMSDPLDYGSRLNLNIPITRFGLIGLVVNGIALIITWNVPVPVHSAG
jgi:hypothetical protein